MKPLVFINFKTYPSGMGKNGIAFARKLKQLQSPYKIIACPQLTEVKEIKKILPVYAQHCDPISPGRHTGFISPRSLKEAGCTGVFLNHSEHPLPLKIIQETVKLCKKVKLQTLIFAGSLREIKKILALKPDYIAYEPPKLVGGKISVTSVNPDIITKAADLMRKPTELIVGAGVHSKSDIKTALLLGAQGVAIASAVMKGTDKQMRKILS